VATVCKSTTADQIEAMAFVCCAMPRPWLPGLATVGNPRTKALFQTS
jgi:hypothetical protein